MRWCCGSTALTTNGEASGGTTTPADDECGQHLASSSVPATTKPSAFSIRRFPMVNGGGGGSGNKKETTFALLGGRAAHVERATSAADTMHLETFSSDTEQSERHPKKTRRAAKGVQYADEAAMAVKELATPGPSTSSICNQIRLQTGFEAYGPMLLRVVKTAVVIGKFDSPDIANHCTFLSTLSTNGWNLNSSSTDIALEQVRKCRPSVILIDEKSVDVAKFVRKIRENQDFMEDVLIAILLDRFPTERRLKLITQLDLQFFFYSSTGISLCEHVARVSARFRAVPALFTVVDEVQQPIKICNDHNVVQYVNRAYELCTGESREMILGACFSSEFTSNNSKHPFAGIPTTSSVVSWADRSTTSLPLPTSTVSVEIQPASEAGTRRGSCAPGMETTPSSTADVQFERRRSSDWHCISVPGTAADERFTTFKHSNQPSINNSAFYEFSQQFVYIKRGSTDASMYRRDSMKSGPPRSHGLIVNAPITEALNALGTIVSKCDESTQMQLKDVIKTLSSAELYMPKVMRFQDNDQIASGYYDALIRIHHPSRQRKRSVVDSRRMSTSSGGTISIPTDGRRVSADLATILENDNLWEFDVLELERITDHHPLSRLGVKIFERWSVNETLNCPQDTLNRWLVVVEANYQSGNAYHNATHAADVLQATSFFLSSEQVGQHVQDHHAMSALIAATIHDLNHPGRGNAFLVNTAARLALLYNDNSVLENHHAALAFQLTLTQSGVNIFAHLSREEFGQTRQGIIDMVLATDMSRHFEHLTRFQQLEPRLGIYSDVVEENREENSMIICRMMVKCADIANPTREWKLCREWAMRIVQEYFDQTAEEMERNLPVTMKCTFVDMFARETFNAWCQFSGHLNLLLHLETNYQNWKSEAQRWDSKIMNILTVHRS